jgi:hypothetical protein
MAKASATMATSTATLEIAKEKEADLAKREEKLRVATEALRLASAKFATEQQSANAALAKREQELASGNSNLSEAQAALADRQQRFQQRIDAVSAPV